MNESYRLAPWADVMYACDTDFWLRKCRGKPKRVTENLSLNFKFEGLKLTQSKDIAAAIDDIQLVTLTKNNHQLLVDEPGVIGWGHNSGFHLLNIAVQFGCRKIILCGYDMSSDHGLHWHGPHKDGLRNPGRPQFITWRNIIDGVSGQLKKFGVEVVNASPISTLQAYPVMSFHEALDHFGVR